MWLLENVTLDVRLAIYFYWTLQPEKVAVITITVTTT